MGASQPRSSTTADKDKIMMDRYEIDARFETFKANFEVVSADGQAKMVTVETSPQALIPDLLDRIERGLEEIEGNPEWWAEWGQRLHTAEVKIAEAYARDKVPDDLEPEFDVDDFEGNVLLREDFLERIKASNRPA
jgi:hypothetical protein